MSRRDPIFLIAAILLHASVVGAVRFVASSSRIDEPSPAKTLDDTAVEIDVAPTTDEPANPLEAPPQPLAHATPPRAPTPGWIAPRGKSPEASPKEVGDITPPNTAPPAEAPLDEKPPPPLPGLDGTPIWAVPGVLPTPPLAGRVAAARPPVIPPAPPAPTGPLAAALDYLASGNPPKPSARVAPPQNFPAAGTLATALAGEIRGSSSPAESTGVFELVINAKGQLLSVNVLAADPAYRKEWDRVAQVITQRFSGQTFPLPDAYAAGSRIRVAVTSRMTMPDGTAHGIPAPKLTIPGLPNEHEIREDSLDDRFRGGGGKAGVPPTKLAAGISFDFDLANIGAKRRRIIHTRISAAPLAPETSQGAAKQP